MRTKKIKHAIMIFTAIFAVAVFCLTGGHFHRAMAERQKTVKEIQDKNAVLTDADYQGLVSLSLPGLSGSSYLFQDESYAYYTDMDGFIERIDSLDIEKEHPTVVSELFSPEKALDRAIDLFDSVFAEQEKQFGKSYQIDTMDFNGVDYMITIVLLDGDYQTGNKASISFDGDGNLLSSMFIKEIKHPDSDMISEEDAKELALRYFSEVYKEELSHAIEPDALEQAEIGDAERIDHKGEVFWDVEVNATYSKTTFSDEPVVDAGTIRINAVTGEYIWFASIFK